jgi:Tfp pilus assembly protein PilF
MIRRIRSTLERGVGISAIVALVGATSAGACAHRGEGDGEGSSDGTPAADKYLEIAIGSFHNGMSEDAKVQVRNALEVDPEHADSHYLMGLILLEEGRDMVHSIDGEMCLVDEAAGHQRERADDLHRKARESFGRAAKAYEDTEPGHGRALNSMAVVSLYFDEYDRAIQEARGALETQFYTERYSALANLGWAYYRGGDRVQAMTELRQSVMFNPDYCVGRYRLAQVYLDHDLNEQAAEEAGKVVADERCPIQDAHRLLGVANLRLGRAEEAGIAFDACVALAPRSCLAGECQRFSQLAAAR